ncbi:hypothetical protein BDY19DRAFT_940215 [Irpex rosettiformis]|uniref:Uncharacterized protein n=1 Tax=Irpex rosettiformis TaxID=378272 RepID=A0ACB8U8F6_9APHY|nr:hypothetical protein BDY19DRAFT_940215 [Irpex rosettiformis]
MDDMGPLAEQLVAVEIISSSSEVDQLEARSQHNARQPIFSLPPELLGKIIGYLRDISPLYPRWIHPSTLKAHRNPLWWHRLRWVMVTHVCRALRNVALSHAELWSTISSTGMCESWSLEFLRRSKSAPITLELLRPGVRDPHPERFLQQIQDPYNICRIRRITTTNTSLLAVAFLQELFEYPAPLLEKLEISRCSGCYARHDDPVVIMPPNCFKSYAPNLREILLEGVSFSWSSFAFSSLTRLIVKRGRASSNLPSSSNWSAQAPAPPTEAFADCLRSLPLLEVLVLQEALPYVPPAGSGLGHSISLPNLQQLRIEDSVSGCAWFLGSLDIPFLIDMLEIHATIDSDLSHVNLSGLLWFLSSYIPRIGAPISELQLDIQQDTLCIDITPYLECDDDISNSFVDRYSVMHTTLKTFELSKLRLLTIAVNKNTAQLADFMDHRFWNNLYHTCASATAIQVQGFATVTLLPFLATRNLPHWTLPAFVEPRAPLFPTLKELAIDLCVGDGLQGASESDREERHVAFVRECLASRAGYAPLLERLYVDMDEELCYLGRELTNSLLSVAKDVDSGVYSW